MEETTPNPENEIELSVQVIIVSEPRSRGLQYSLDQKINKTPKLLNSRAADKSCSIFRVPQNIMELHPKYFQPGIVSIGPYYHGEEGLEMMEEQKCRILGDFLGHVKQDGVDLDEVFKAVEEKEEEIRGCYSHSIDKYSPDELIEMMIIDGVFIINLLCVVGKIMNPEPDDPIFNFPWMLSSVTKDLLMLENQIPFVVLQTLYDKSIGEIFQGEVPSLQELILILMNISLPRYSQVSKLCDKYKTFRGKHILDFYRSTYIPSPGSDARGKTLWRWCCRQATDGRGHLPPSSSSRVILIANDANPSASTKETTERSSSLQSGDRGENDMDVQSSLQELTSTTSEESTDPRANLSSSSSSTEETTDGSNSLQIGNGVDNTDLESGSSSPKSEVTTAVVEVEESQAAGGIIRFKKYWMKKLRGLLVGIHVKADTDESLIRFIQPVETLLQAGIKFKKREGTDSFLDIEFSHGALKIPRLVTGEITSTLILNCIMFEQCYKHRTKHFISYFNFMGRLMNTTFDVGYLREKKIIENFFGTEQELVNFFNDVGKSIIYYFNEDYLVNVAENVEIYYRSVRHVGWAEFKYKYCGSLWICLSASAALLLVLLTILQTFYIVYPYYHPRN